MSYTFHPSAETEHLEAVAFYESRQLGLGAAYIRELEHRMSQVVLAPQRYRIERKPNIRRVALARFPYKIIFRDIKGVVQILAVSHQRRRPDYWLGRI